MALFDAFGCQLIDLAQQLQKQSENMQAKNSKNSSKPPSSDGYGKQNRTES